MLSSAQAIGGGHEFVPLRRANARHPAFDRGTMFLAGLGLVLREEGGEHRVAQHPHMLDPAFYEPVLLLQNGAHRISSGADWISARAFVASATRSATNWRSPRLT